MSDLTCIQSRCTPKSGLSFYKCHGRATPGSVNPIQISWVGFFIAFVSCCLYTFHMILTVQWPSLSAQHVELWRVLDLAGITRSPRDSELAVKSGAVFVDGERVTNQKHTISVGRVYRIEVNQGLRQVRNYVRVVNTSPRGRQVTVPRRIHYRE